MVLQEREIKTQQEMQFGPTSPTLDRTHGLNPDGTKLTRRELLKRFDDLPENLRERTQGNMVLTWMSRDIAEERKNKQVSGIVTKRLEDLHPEVREYLPTEIAEKLERGGSILFGGLGGYHIL